MTPNVYLFESFLSRTSHFNGFGMHAANKPNTLHYTFQVSMQLNVTKVEG